MGSQNSFSLLSPAIIRIESPRWKDKVVCKIIWLSQIVRTAMWSHEFVMDSFFPISSFDKTVKFIRNGTSVFLLRFITFWAFLLSVISQICHMWNVSRPSGPTSLEMGYEVLQATGCCYESTSVSRCCYMTAFQWPIRKRWLGSEPEQVGWCHYHNSHGGWHLTESPAENLMPIKKVNLYFTPYTFNKQNANYSERSQSHSKPFVSLW